MRLRASLVAFAVFLASCGMTSSKRSVVQEELWNFNDALQHLDKDTSQQTIATYQERLIASAGKIERSGDSTNKADLAVSFQARWCVEDLDCVATARASNSENSSREEQRDKVEQMQRCRESFAQDVAELNRMAK